MADFSTMAVQRRALGAANLSNIVESIGTQFFGARVVNYLHNTCNADHFAAFCIDGGGLRSVATGSSNPHGRSQEFLSHYVNHKWWRRDPAIMEAQSTAVKDMSSVIRPDLDSASYAEIREVVYPTVRDRLLICGRREEVVLGLSVIRTKPHAHFGRDDIEQMAGDAGLLMSMLSKHIDVLDQRPNVATALATLHEIQSCIAAMSELPRREGEVCARILYGLSSVGISLDLGIGEQSVKTYRKRAYERLTLGGERDLLKWYLALWSTWRRHYHCPALKH